MFCPKCGAEYKKGFSECADCMVDLVENPPAPVSHEKKEFVPVFESSDPMLISVAKSLLDGEGIDFFVYKEGLQDLIGGGRLGGINPLIGHVQFQVDKKDAEKAEEILDDLLKEE